MATFPRELKVLPIKQFLRLELPALQGRDGIALIVCSDAPVSSEKFRGLHVLQVSFADVTDGMDAFSLYHARKIAVFVDELPADIRRLYVCCDAGQSRSPAIAAAITRYFGCDHKVIWKNPKYRPNPHVYRVLCEELRLNCSPLSVKYLTWINRRRFSRAVRKSRAR